MHRGQAVEIARQMTIELIKTGRYTKGMLSDLTKEFEALVDFLHKLEDSETGHKS